MPRPRLMSRFDSLFLAELDRLGRAGLRRTLVPVEPTSPGPTLRGGPALLNF